MGLLVPRSFEIVLGKRMLLDAILSSRGGALLSAALSFFCTKSSSISSRPDQHSRRVDSDNLLFKPVPRLLAFGRISRCSCVMLSRSNGKPRVCRFVYL